MIMRRLMVVSSGISMSGQHEPIPLWRVLKEEHDALRPSGEAMRSSMVEPSALMTSMPPGELAPESGANASERTLGDHQSGWNSTKNEENKLEEMHERMLAANFAALCISGGGIRSATFSLGVVTGLARRGLLREFDYLSSVSGGGYIGSWLVAWIHRVMIDQARSRVRMPRDVQTAVGNGFGHDSATAPPDSIGEATSRDTPTDARLGVAESSSSRYDETSSADASIGVHRSIDVDAPSSPNAEMPNPIDAVAHKLSGVSEGHSPGSDVDEKPPSIDIVAHELSGVAEPKTVDWLRQYSKYLAPRSGMLSSDVWTLVATYIRNLLLTWITLAPGFLAALGIPWLLLWALTTEQVGWRFAWLIGSVFILFGIGLSHWFRSAPHGAVTRHGKRPAFWSSGLVLLGTISLAWWWWPSTRHTVSENALVLSLLPVPFLFVVAQSAGIVRRWVTKESTIGDSLKYGLGAFFAGTACAALIWLWVRTFHDAQSILYLTVAVPALLIVLLLSEIALVGFTSTVTSDDDREWWARYGAWVLILCAAWISITVVVTVFPLLVREAAVAADNKAVRQMLTAVLGSGSILSLLTLVLGFSSKSPATAAARGAQGATGFTARLPLGVLAGVVVLFALALLSIGTYQLIYHDVDGSHFDVTVSHGAWVLILVVAVATLFAGWPIGTNRFSLHAMYRNRLIRAYLGASRVARRPNSFTGFDAGDNFPLHWLWPELGKSQSPFRPVVLAASDSYPRCVAASSGGDSQTRPSVAQEAEVLAKEVAKASRRRPYPLYVINTALNLVTGKDLAWQQRKASSFTMSPLHCGGERVGFRRSSEFGGDDGVTIGTAVAISGAAASPNMGYHSSPAVTFLLTLANIRLGWWLGNPNDVGNESLRMKPTWRKAEPRHGLKPLFAETFGLTNDKNPWLYLSDGGHFENLGLYEMVRRRCRRIIVIDGSADPTASFEDLANAIQKIRVDLRIGIEPVPVVPEIFAREAHISGKYCALFRIRYPETNNVNGRFDGDLLYIKPAIYGNEPIDVANYALNHPAFPHETTANQFFSEQQFESYRHLGEFIVDKVAGDATQVQSLDDLFQVTRRYVT
jgi:hypothetical protein